VTGEYMWFWMCMSFAFIWVVAIQVWFARETRRINTEYESQSARNLAVYNERKRLLDLAKHDSSLHPFVIRFLDEISYEEMYESDEPISSFWDMWMESRLSSTISGGGE
jgi:hypothetical protein